MPKKEKKPKEPDPEVQRKFREGIKKPEKKPKKGK